MSYDDGEHRLKLELSSEIMYRGYEIGCHIKFDRENDVVCQFNVAKEGVPMLQNMEFWRSYAESSFLDVNLRLKTKSIVYNYFFEYDENL